MKWALAWFGYTKITPEVVLLSQCHFYYMRRLEKAICRSDANDFADLLKDISEQVRTSESVHLYLKSGLQIRESAEALQKNLNELNT